MKKFLQFAGNNIVIVTFLFLLISLNVNAKKENSLSYLPKATLTNSIVTNAVNEKIIVNPSFLPKATLTSYMETPETYSGGSGTITSTNNFTSFSSCLSTSSAAQSFTIAASSLNASSTVVLSAPAGFELSTSSAGTYSTTLVVNQTSAGTVTNTTLYIRLSASASAGTFTGTLGIASSGANTDLSIVMPSSTVNALPTITGTATTVIGGTSTLSSTIAGGTWSSSTTAVATITSLGVVTGVANGTTTITYTTPSGCATTVSFTVAGPSITKSGTITAFTACVGTATAAQTFTVSASGLTASSTVNLATPAGFEIATTSGGTYSSSISLAENAGTVTNTTIYLRLSASAATGTYSGSISLTSSGATTQTITIPASTVNALPTITGTATTVIGGTSTLSSTVSGGTWSSSTPAIATITSPGGVVTGVANGTTTITYTTSSGCATTVSFTVAGPSITKSGTISAFATCATTASASQTFSVTGADLTNNIVITIPTGFEIATTSGGTYTSSSLTLTQSSGTVTNTSLYLRLSASAAAGTYSGSISLTSTSATTQTISIPASTVNALPNITGTLTTVIGGTSTLSSTITGGTWSSSTTAVATISSSGVVTGVANGTTTITYTATTGCATTVSFTVSGPSITKSGTISALATCIGTASASQTFTVTGSGLTNNIIITSPTGYEIATTSGGTYSSSITLTQSSGSVTNTSIFVRITAAATSAPTGTISITSTGAIAQSISIPASTVNALPTIRIGSNPYNLSGPIGSTTLTGSAYPATSNTWVSSNTAVGTITGTGSTNGVVTGLKSGITKITYTDNNGCVTSSLFRVGSGKVLWYVTNTAETTPNADVTLKTIPSAINQSLTGDTIIVYEGTYKDKIDYGSKNLILASRYLLDLDSTHISRTKIDGTGVAQNNDWWDPFIRQTNFTSDTSLQKFIGFKVMNTQGIAIMFNGGVIRNNIFTNNITKSYDLSVIRVAGVKVENNIFDANKGSFTILAQPFNQGDHAWTYINNNIFKNQSLVTTDGNAGLLQSSFQKVKISNNLFHNNKSPNLISVGGDAVDSVITIHNTFVDNLYNNTYWSSYFYHVRTWENSAGFLNLLTNNILVNSGILRSTNNKSVDFNVSNNYATVSLNELPENFNTNGNYYQKNNFFADNSLKFVDSANKDFRLDASSFGIGYGLDTAIIPNTDFYNNARPLPAGTKPDIGAFENTIGIPQPILYVTPGQKKNYLRWDLVKVPYIDSVFIYRSTDTLGTTVPYAKIGSRFNDTAATNKIMGSTKSPFNASDYTYIGAYGGSIYYMSKANATWTNAKNLANEQGGQLVCIETAEENNFINTARQNINGSSFWAGGYQIDKTNEPKGSWYWINGKPITMNMSGTNFGSGEPNNSGGSEDYLQINNGGSWNDINDNSQIPYIIEYDGSIGAVKLDNYVDSVNITNGTKYFYKIQTTDKVNTSLYSLIKSATPNVGAKLPTDLTAQASSNAVKISWTNPTGQVTGKYIIYHSTDSFTKDNSVVDTVLNTTTSLKDANLFIGKNYYYRIKSIDQNGIQSDYSNIVSVKVTSLIYIDPNGNDNNFGSPTAPFKTLGAAVDFAQSRDTIVFNNGTHLNSASVSIQKKLFITSKYQFTKDSADIKNTILTGGTDFVLFSVSNTYDTVTIQGLTIQNHGNIAISANVPIVVNACIFKNNGNTTTQNGFLNLGNGAKVSNSTFDSNNGYINVNDRGAIIDANKFFNNKFGASNVNYLFQEGSGKITISNNLFVQNGTMAKDDWQGTASAIINTGGWGGDTTFIINNTFINNNAYAVLFSLANERRAVLVNNLFSNPAGDILFQKSQYSNNNIPGATLIYANILPKEVTEYNNYKSFSVKADKNIISSTSGMIDLSTYKVKSNFIGIAEGVSNLKLTNGTVYYTVPAYDLYGKERKGIVDIGAEQTNNSIVAPTIDNIEGGSNKNLIIIKPPFNKAKVKSFKIYVSNQSISDTSTTAKLVATITDTLKYSDASVVNGTRYYYRVKAVDTSAAANLSPYSNEFAVTPNIPPGRIDSLIMSTAPRAALLKWGKQASDIKYLVLSGYNKDSLSVLANNLDSNTYLVNNLIKGKDYWFAVQAIDNGGATSVISNIVKYSATNTWYVDTIPTSINLGSAEYPYNVIQNVIDIAEAGDTILINNGTYAENLQLFNKSLTLKARNLSKAIIDPVDARTKSTLNIQDIANCCYEGIDYIKPRNNIIGLVFTGNTAIDWGNNDAPAVLNITNNSNPLFESCTFNYNSSQYLVRFDRSAPAFNNCLIVNNNLQNGLFQVNYEDTTRPRTNIPRFVHSVFDNNSFFSRGSSTINGIAILNSIVSNNGYDEQFNETNFRIANSIVDNKKLADRSSTNLFADPQFNNPSSFDYSLSNSSPALGRGGSELIITGSQSVDTVRTLDYDFNYSKRPNPSGTKSDIGAFESKYSVSAPYISRLQRSGTNITLTWEKPNSNTTFNSIKVYRDTLASALDTVAALNITVDVNKATISDVMPSNRVYYYAVKATVGSVNTGLSNIKSTLDTVFIPNLNFATDTASLQIRAASRQGNSLSQMTNLVKLAADDATAMPKFVIYSQDWKQIDSTKALTADSLTVININKQSTGTNSIKLSLNKSVLIAKSKTDYLQIVSAMNVNNDDEFDLVGIYRKGTDANQQSRIAYLTNSNLTFKLDTTNAPANFYNPNINSWNQTKNLTYKWDQKTFQHNDGAVNFGQNIESTAEFMDANFDGKQELVATLNQVKWEPNATLNSSNNSMINNVNSSVRPIKFVDINSDGIPDIFAMTNWAWSIGISQANGNPLVVFVSNKKDGKFYMYLTGLNIGGGSNVFFGDFSNNRKIQVLTRVNGGNYRVYDFDNNFSAVNASIQLDATLNDGKFDVADINNDSYPDIITVDNSGNFFAYVNNHATSFSKKIIGATPFVSNAIWSIFNVKVVDINRDGFKDIMWYEVIPKDGDWWNTNNYQLRTWLQTPGTVLRTAPPAIALSKIAVTNDGYKVKVKWKAPKDDIDNYLFANVKVDTLTSFKSARINDAYNYRSSNPTIPIILDKVFAKNYPDSLEFTDINLTSRKPYSIAIQMVNKEGQASQFTSTVFVPTDPLKLVDNLIPGLRGARFAWGDYNKDGLMDLAVLGESDNGNVTNVFKNTGTGFENLNLTIRPFRYGDIKWVDLNNDGWLDIAIIGQPGGAGVSFQTLINNKGIFEINTPTSVYGLKKSNMAFGDYDNNGTIDMFTSGQDAVGIAKSYLYTNDGKGNFTNVPELNSLYVVPNMFDADAKFVDYDLDGDLDLVYAGTDQSNSPVGGVRVNTILDPKITSNNYSDANYNNGYTYNLSSWNSDCQCNIGLSMNNARFDIGDIDGDGDMDIVEIGTNKKSTGAGFTLIPQLVIIRNQTVENKNAKYGNYFSYQNLYSTSVVILDSISDGDIKLVDFNNDGLLDITVTGLDVKSNAVTKFYLNQGGFGNFTLSNNNSIAQYSSSAISWGDANGDGDMDLVISGLKNSGGSSTSIYLNNQGANGNKAPTAPKNLRFIDQGQGRILLQWDAATDDHTIASNLYYNLKLGTKPGLSDLRVIQVNETNGKLLTPNTSLIGTNQYYIELPPGVYFWSVQAIDGNYSSSTFAPNQKIVLKYPWQFVNQGGIVDSRILPLENPAFAWADVNNKGVFDFLYLGTGNNANDFNNTPVGLYRNMGGKFAKFKNDSSQSSLAGKGTGFYSTLSGIANAKIKWVDLNNDNYLDLVVAGDDISSQQGRLSVFRNLGNYKFEDITNQVYTGAKLSTPTIELVDLDNNGLKDLVYTGVDNQGIGQFKFIGFYKDSTLKSNSGKILGFKVAAINCNLDALLTSKQVSNVILGFGDLNKDLKPDLAIIYDDGYNAARVGTVYMNNSDTTTTNTFNLSFVLNNTITLPAFRNATLDLIDNNNDGRLDLAISGRTDVDGQVFRIYQNKWIDSTKKTIQFVQTNAEVKPFEKGYTTWGDINADGYPDIIFNGTRAGVGAITAMALADPNSLSTSGILKYNELPTFPFGNYTTLRPSLGDFSGKRLLDLVLVGTEKVTNPTSNTTETVSSFKILKNVRDLAAYVKDTITSFAGSNGSSLFNEPVIKNMSVSNNNKTADFANNIKAFVLDSSIAVVDSNYVESLYSSNIAPTKPLIDSASIISKIDTRYLVQLNWKAASDDNTPSSGLNYAVSVGTAPGLSNILDPNADLNSGTRKTPDIGNAGKNTSVNVLLSPGVYYYSVQSIDASNSGSKFSETKTIQVGTNRTLVERSAPYNILLNNLLDSSFYLKQNDSSGIKYKITAYHGDATAKLKYSFISDASFVSDTALFKLDTVNNLLQLKALPTQNTYKLKLRVTDNYGVYFDKAYEFRVILAPSNILVNEKDTSFLYYSNATADSAKYTIALKATYKVDPTSFTPILTYGKATGTNSTHNDVFELVNSVLINKRKLDDADTLRLRVNVTDQFGLVTERVIMLVNLDCTNKPSFTLKSSAAACLPNTVNLKDTSFISNATLGLSYSYFSDVSTTQKVVLPTQVGAGTFYIKGTNATGCAVVRNITVTTASKPANPVVSATAICQNEKQPTIGYTAPNASTKLVWYGNNATGGTASTTLPIFNIANAGTQTFYVAQADTLAGCYGDRVKLDVVVKALPTTATISRDTASFLISTSVRNNIWYKDNAIVDSTGVAKFKPTSAMGSGSYTVKVLENGCYSAMSTPYYYFFNILTDIVNLGNNEFIQISPNPFIHYLNFDYKVKGYKDLNIEFYDMTTGQRVMVKEKVTPGSRLNVQALPSGTYLVRVVSNDYKLKHQFKMIKM